MQRNIVDEYKENITRAGQLFKEIDSINLEMPNTSFFSKERVAHLSKLKHLRNELDITSKGVRKLFDELRENSSYDSDYIIPLIKDYISFVEGEEYCILNLNGSTTEDIFGFQLITTLENKERIEKNNISRNIDECINACSDNKFVCFESKETQTLLDSFELFFNYPYLVDFSFELLSIRISNPNYEKESVKELVFTKKEKR